MNLWTASKIRSAKGHGKLACLTATDFCTARILDEAGIPLILVGDSLAMTVLGYETTLPVSVAEMLHHTAAVSRGVKNALVVADMPFMSYQTSVEQALRNAGRFVKKAGAGAVKIEGGTFRAPTAEALVRNGIPVLGHIGLTPQSLNAMGGYRVQGRKPEEAEKLLADAHALEQAGIFALVLECLPAELGAEVTESVSVPTIGIGAGPHCDGQILVLHDLLGFSSQVAPKFVRQYSDFGPRMRKAVDAYSADVSSGKFPAPENCYS